MILSGWSWLDFVTGIITGVIVSAAGFLLRRFYHRFWNPVEWVFERIEGERWRISNVTPSTRLQVMITTLDGRVVPAISADTGDFNSDIKGHEFKEYEFHRSWEYHLRWIAGRRYSQLFQIREANTFQLRRRRKKS